MRSRAQRPHRVDEDRLRRRPLERLDQLLRDEPQVESLLIRMSRQAAKALGERGRIAVLAARADLHAAPNRIPGGIRPFDLGGGAHEATLSLDRNHAPVPDVVHIR